MVRRQPQKDDSDSIRIKIAQLLSLLGVLVGLWVHFDSSRKADEGSKTDSARSTGALEAFKEKQQQTDKDFLDGMRRLNDRLSAHATESEAEHREMRRDIEEEFRRDIDQTCQCYKKDRRRE